MHAQCDLVDHDLDYRVAWPRGWLVFAPGRRDDWNQSHRHGTWASHRGAKATRSILAPPLEHHVRVDAVRGGELRYRHVRRAGQYRQLPFEIDRIIRAAFTARPCNAVCCQHGSRHSNGGRHFALRYRSREDGLGETLTFFPQSIMHGRATADTLAQAWMRGVPHSSLPTQRRRIRSLPQPCVLDVVRDRRCPAA